MQQQREQQRQYDSQRKDGGTFPGSTSFDRPATYESAENHTIVPSFLEMGEPVTKSDGFMVREGLPIDDPLTVASAIVSPTSPLISQVPTTAVVPINVDEPYCELEDDSVSFVVLCLTSRMNVIC